MQKIGAPAEGYVKEAEAGVGGGDNDGIELGELIGKARIRSIAVAADLSENLNSFVSASIRDEPTAVGVSQILN